MRLGSIGTAAHLVREAGPGWIAWRAWMAVSHRLGLDQRRTPAAPWAARPLGTWLRPGIPSDPDGFARWRAASSPRGVLAGVPAPELVGARAVEEADRLLEGAWPFFSGEWLTLGWPPAWHRHPLSGCEWDRDLHWSVVPDASADDIKYLWEPGRFSAAFTLSRAHARTRDERYAAAVWDLIDDWIAANPPMRGVHWRCGQETALRLLAWCFGLEACGRTAAATPERLARVVVAVAWQAERIEAHLGYARSQKNNHALSEAVGLLTVGTLFPELARSSHWREVGARVLAEELRRQVYADGAFVQHATNYHRVMLHDVAWAVALARHNDVALPPDVEGALARGTRWLRLLTDPDTGRAPNFGNNDGALVLPLSDCDYDDMRPALRLAAHVLGADAQLPPGPWDEPAAWLAGPRTPSPAAPAARAVLPAPGELALVPQGGQALLRGARTRVVVRCARFVDRPAHADQLHVDMWWAGSAVACDAGTYRYSAEPPWDHALARSAVHNTITLDGADQMQRVSRFLWTRWAQGTLEGHGSVAGVPWVRARHDGYEGRGLRHARAALALDDHVIVVDDVVAGPGTVVRLQWLLDGTAVLDDATGVARLATPAGEVAVRLWASASTARSLVRGGSPEEPTRGWVSPTYGVRRPASSIVVRLPGSGASRLVTVLGPDAAGSIIDPGGDSIRLHDGGRLLCVRVPTAAPPVIEPCP